MPKLIFRPGQCGARSEDKKPMCTINGFVFLSCPSAFNFPTNCPLPNGINANPLTVDELIQIVKKTILLHKSRKTKRRNRKNCTKFQDHHIPITPLSIQKNYTLKGYNKGKCQSDPQFTGNFPDCTGVNCGYFESKTK